MASSSELRPGVLEQLMPGVHRLVAPNGGPMTGPGTNSYLLGQRRQVVIDPGPAIVAHVDAIMAASGGELSHIIVTHTHADHSPAAATLAKLSGARLVGLCPPALPRQDQSFRPDIEPDDGQVIEAGDVQLRAIHTPGHASNHICYLMDDRRLLFTGDHVMQGSTVVIPPPDGDMAAYIDSLRKVEALEVAKIAPGHGTIIDDPQRALRRLVRHRLQREARVLARLAKAGRATLAELLVDVYDDVSKQLHPVAEFSLHAHLIKLRDEGRVVQDGQHWRVSDIGLDD